MENPDKLIADHATGLAAITAANHQQQQELTLYAAWFCPFAQRVWIALEEKDIPYQRIEVNPYRKEAHFLAVNPRGLVPAVTYKGHAVYESQVLFEFFEEAFPLSKQLFPSNPYDRALARIWMDHITTSFVPAQFKLMHATNIQEQNEYLNKTYESLRQFSDNIKGPYFFGEDFGIVDVAISSWISRDWVLAEHRGYSREGVSPVWKAYADLVGKRKSVMDTSCLPENILKTYYRNGYLSRTVEGTIKT